jgi:hypothetical protein
MAMMKVSSAGTVLADGFRACTIIVGSDPRSLAVGESKWDAKRISETFHSVLQQRNKIRELKLKNNLHIL